jgi:hypothetical protein
MERFRSSGLIETPQTFDLCIRGLKSGLFQKMGIAGEFARIHGPIQPLLDLRMLTDPTFEDTGELGEELLTG